MSEPPEISISGPAYAVCSPAGLAVSATQVMVSTTRRGRGAEIGTASSRTK